MKTYYTKTHFLVVFLLPLIYSCASNQQKPDEAYKNVKWDKTNTYQTPADLEIIKEPTKMVVVKKQPEAKSEWNTFRIATETRIKATETKIEAIKSNPALTNKDQKKLAVLEKSNNDLRNQLNEYNREANEKWEAFKTKMAENMTQLNNEIDVISPNDKK